jgi:hypothetical protein
VTPHATLTDVNPRTTTDAQPTSDPPRYVAVLPPELEGLSDDAPALPEDREAFKRWLESDDERDLPWLDK